MRAWIESLCVYGALFMGQKLRDIKHKDSREETGKVKNRSPLLPQLGLLDEDM